MSSSVIASLLRTYQRIIIYSGIPILTLGVLGGVLNTIVFLSLKTFRQSSCAFYLTVLSIVNIGQLLAGLFSRIMISGFSIDWTQTSLFYCKFRTFSFQVTSMISFTCICFATIDQYLATCARPRWQRWSNIKIAHRVMIIGILVALIEQSPCLIFYDHVKTPPADIIVCTTTNNGFVQFNAYFNYLILGNLLPCSITLAFGWMAYRNTKELGYRTVPLIRRELDKQLTIMVLVQIVYTLVSLSPNTILYLILSYGNIQNSVIVAKLRLAYTITVCLYYTCFAVRITEYFKCLFNSLVFI
jgi:hypothetical protein